MFRSALPRVEFVSLVLCLLLSIASETARAQLGGDIQAPIERNGFRASTSYDALQSFLSSLDQVPFMTVSTLGTTPEGHAITMVRVASGLNEREPKLRIMLFAQQHGDEPSGKEALTMLLARCASGEYARHLRAVELYIVPQVNPDGAEKDQRRNSRRQDLNRSHLLVDAPETIALHQAFLALWPEVTMDIHEYGTSGSWTRAGMMKTGDVQLGMLTNLNVPAAIRDYQRAKVFPFLAEAMRARGYSFHEYLVGAPDMYLRHSTTEPNDGRQSLGIQGTLSFIQEGKNAGNKDSLLQRRATSQFVSIDAFIRYCAEHAVEIKDLVQRERELRTQAAGKPFVLRMNHVSDGRTLEIPVRTVPGGIDTVWSIHPYLSVVRPTLTTTLPQAYVVPRALASLPLLAGHGVQLEVVNTPTEQMVQRSMIDSVGYEVVEEDSVLRVYTHTVETTATLQPGDIIVRLNQRQSYLLATAFEPQSLWGLVKYPEHESLLRSREFPILRIP